MKATEGAIIDVFRTDEPVIDKWAFVLNEVNPYNNYHTMIATSETGFGFSQFCEGFYEPGEANRHLGERPRIIGEALVNHVLGRLRQEEYE